MAFDWRKLLGLNRTDDPSAGDGPHVRTVGGRSYAVGDSIAGEYRVLDKFAGGMGFVYLVDRHDEDTPFVLKTLQRQEDDSWNGRSSSGRPRLGWGSAGTAISCERIS